MTHTMDRPQSEAHVQAPAQTEPRGNAQRWNWLLAGAALCFAFAAGAATTVFAQAGARTYSTKGKVIAHQGGKLLIKDKFGVEWEYNMPKNLETSVGKEVKVVYTMQALKIEAP